MNTETDTHTEMKPLDVIERLAGVYAMHREDLAGELKEMEAQLQAVRDHFLPMLKRSAALTGQAKDRLSAAIEAHPELFVKPRSVQLHGIKCGYQAVAEKVEPGPNTVELIEKHFPKAAEVLIKTEKKPVKAQLKELSRGDRRKVGCTTVPSADIVLIKPTGDAIEKMVDKIIEDASAASG